MMDRNFQTVLSPAAADRIELLDGWRALSILAVLAGHWLPIGPGGWQLNGAVSASGMAIFFTLSGFLITRLLLHDPHVGRFLIRRLFRIVPLAWLAMAILAFANRADAATIAANFLFTANLPPAQLMVGGGPLWSLCVEIHFYLGVAMLVGVFGRRALYALPAMAVGVTIARIYAGEIISIVTWHRIDEILAGATVALLIEARRARSVHIAPPPWLCVVLLAALLLSAHPASGPLGYLRPYFAAAAVGTSLLAAPALLARIWTSRPARYVAEVSYALYVFHGMLTATWLGGEDVSKLQKYALRPLLIGATFLLAHISTYHYEKRWIALGKRLAQKSRPASEAPARSAAAITD